MFIKPTKDAIDIFEITDEALIYPVNDDVACPWDADIMIDGDRVILQGSILGGSSATYKTAGVCRCECSIENFTNFYKIEIPNDEEIMDMVLSNGWVEV